MNRLDSTTLAEVRREEAPLADGRDAFLLGLRALAREEIAPALRHLERAATLLPGNAEVQAYLGCALLAAGSPDEAIEATEMALRLAPDGFGPNLKGGELALRLGDPGLAEQRFLAALRAAEPASRDAAAARTLLSEARRRGAHSIRREAFLPSLRPRLRLRGRIAPGRGEMSIQAGAATRPGEAGGTIA